jgi:protein TonB
MNHHTRVTASQPVSAHTPVNTAPDATRKQVVEANTESTDTNRSASANKKKTAADSAEKLAASSPFPSQEESDRHLRSSVLELITQRLSYPAIARRKGWQGVVTLELHIESDGLISSLQVNETSGYPALDQAAVKSLQLASIPGARHWLHGRSIDMLIPVEYRLLDS